MKIEFIKMCGKLLKYLTPITMEVVKNYEWRKL